jgi:DNA-binding NtrC family response regulator
MTENSLTAVIVSDNQDVLEVVVAIFQRLGFKTKMASGGNKALHLIQSERFDLLVTDYDMPKINGFQLAIAAKNEFPGTSVFIMTGWNRPEVSAEMNSDLVDGWLFKPFGIDSVLELLRNINQTKNSKIIPPMKN